MESLSVKDLDSVKSLIDNFKPRITTFERNILVPEVIDRLQYVVGIMRSIQEITDDPSVALQIDAPLRSLVDERLYELGAPEPRIGVQYLASMKRIIQQEYIDPIENFLAENPKESILQDFDSASSFLNNAVIFLRSITDTKDMLFWYSFKTFVNLRNSSTGAVVLGPPVELALILMPFEVRVKEMANVAETMIKSIQLWGEQIGEQKQKHVEIIANLCQIKSSESQERAARLNLYAQIAVIFLAVVLIVASYKANQYPEKVDLEESLTSVKEELKEKGMSLEAAERKAKDAALIIESLQLKLEAKSAKKTR